MQPADPEHNSAYPIPPCDICHSRKVRCDRGNPCGNCIDQNLQCLRQRSRRRLPKRNVNRLLRAAQSSLENARRPSPSSSLPVAIPETFPSSGTSDDRPNRDGNQGHSMSEDGSAETLRSSLTTFHEPSTSLNGGVLAWNPHHNPIDISFDFSNFGDSLEQRLIHEAQKALNSALFNATQAVSGPKEELPSDDDRSETLETFSPEFLSWMLQDIGGPHGGRYVWDYCKHVSKQTLKHMSMSLLSGRASPHEKSIFTVCLGGAAHKFLNIVLASSDQDDELNEHLQQKSLNYKQAALLALEKIPLTVTPSLPLLQALLCGIFIHQGSGNASIARDLTRTACRIATDLDLHINRSDVSLSEEESFCLLWCYMLDQNYAWKFETSRRFFNPDPGLIDRHIRHTSELLTIYIIMAQVQDATLSSTKPIVSSTNESQPSDHTIHREQSLQKLDQLRERIQQISIAPADDWKGLETANEVATLQFAHNSIRTKVLYLSEQQKGQTPKFGESLLRSARQEVSSLVTICLISERHRAVAFLHWTLMYYPLTAWFVLFCNTITTSHHEDLGLLKILATSLMPNVSLSHPVTVIQQLCGDFIALSQSHFTSMQGGPGTTVEDNPYLLPIQSSQNHGILNSVVAPFTTGSASGSFTSVSMSEMYPATGTGDDSSTMDMIVPNASFNLDFSSDSWFSGVS